ncbi:glycoside hydrolase family 172 protein [Winogradskyella forsetii]|uniref:glycoside hydrolase family 172 protein n=1 Tax=Winogradskyella forsetii TaxID=2686077 RepID=UPI0015C13E73|nr:glycoside hydrolase family 172 protein [Winogradskyella forsetii]
MKIMLSSILLFLTIAQYTCSGQELFDMPKDKITKWISFENRSGDKGKGGIENKGAKGHAFNALKAGESIDLMDLEGSGTVRRIWMTFNDRSPEMLRAIKIEMFWDNSETPAVSAPIGDFFGIGLGQRLPFQSQLFSDPEGRSFNCAIPMPFKKHAKITITNESNQPLNQLFYDVNILMEAHDEDMLYFHSYWSRANKTKVGKDFEILPKVTGKGRFIGTNMGVKTDPELETTWYGEGEVKMYIDGDSDYPTLVGTGTEDYIGTAYGQQTYSHMYQGSPIANTEKGIFAFYRYHIPDPVFFYDDISVSIQIMGGAGKDKVQEFIDKGLNVKPVTIHNDLTFIKLLELEPEVKLRDPSLPNGWTNFYREDDVSATAYFYLDQPQNELSEIAPVKERTADLPKK